jgi:hypothetical protein
MPWRWHPPEDDPFDRFALLVVIGLILEFGFFLWWAGAFRPLP